MGDIPEFTDNETWIVKSTLSERFGSEIPVDAAEAEIRLNPYSAELTDCPVLVWEARDANFVIFKVGDRRYRAMFFYRVREQYGTGIDEFDDLTECVVTLLQVHADHEAERAKAQDK